MLNVTMDAKTMEVLVLMTELAFKSLCQKRRLQFWPRANEGSDQSRPEKPL